MDKGRLSHIHIYFWCLSFLKRYLFYFIIFIVLIGIQKAAYVFMPKAIQLFIDDVVINGDQSNIQYLIFSAIGIICTIFITQAFAAMAQLIYVEKGMMVLQYKAIDKSRELGFSYYENTPAGQIMSDTFQNILSVYFLYERYLPNIIQNTFTFISSAIMIILTKNVFVIIFTLISYIAITLIILLTKQKIYQQNIKIRDESNGYYKSAYDGLESIQEVKTFNASNWMKNKILSKKNKLNKWELKQFVFLQKINISISICQAAAAASCFLIGLVFGRSISIGNIIVCYMYITMSVGALTNLLNTFIEQSRVLTDAEKPYQFMHMEPEIKDVAEDRTHKIEEGTIRFSHVSFQYNQHEVLRDVSFHIKKGEKVVLVGGSGNGKTTILKLLLRYYDCDKGEIWLDNQSISSYSFEELRDKTGIVFQEMFFFTDSIRENLCFANPYADEGDRIKSTVLSEAHDFIKALPNGYDTIIGAKGEELSGGQMQRLSIARIFLKNPKIFLLDEITSNIDTITENRIIDNLLAHTGDQTVLSVSHRLSVIKKFDRILVLEEGRIVEDGTYENLCRNGTHFYHIVQKGMLQDD